MAAAVCRFDLLWRSDPIFEIYLALITSKKQLRLGGWGGGWGEHSLTPGVKGTWHCLAQTLPEDTRMVLQWQESRKVTHYTQ